MLSLYNIIYEYMKKSITIISIAVWAGVLTGCHFSNMQSEEVSPEKHSQDIIDREHPIKEKADEPQHVAPHKNNQIKESVQKENSVQKNVAADDGDTARSVTISVPYISGEGDVGCGVGIKFVSYQVPHTKGVLNAVYTKLFDRSQGIAPEYRNTVQAYELTYDSVTLSDGVARVYLSGSMYGPDHCALPELRALIDQAAFQFDTVDTVTVYLNGEIYDWCEKDVSGGETGCPAEKQLWIDKKEE